jgi:hypothetical protein
MRIDTIDLNTVFDSVGRPEAPNKGSEFETLVGFLEFQRATMEWKCARPDKAGLMATVAPSSMTLGGMLKHLAYVKDHWCSRWLCGNDPQSPWDAVDWNADPDWDWHSATEDTPSKFVFCGRPGSTALGRWSTRRSPEADSQDWPSAPRHSASRRVCGGFHVTPLRSTPGTTAASISCENRWMVKQGSSSFAAWVVQQFNRAPSAVHCCYGTRSVHGRPRRRAFQRPYGDSIHLVRNSDRGSSMGDIAVSRRYSLLGQRRGSTSTRGTSAQSPSTFLRSTSNYESCRQFNPAWGTRNDGQFRMQP